MNENSKNTQKEKYKSVITDNEEIIRQATEIKKNNDRQQIIKEFERENYESEK